MHPPTGQRDVCNDPQCGIGHRVIPDSGARTDVTSIDAPGIDDVREIAWDLQRFVLHNSLFPRIPSTIVQVSYAETHSRAS